MRFSLAPKILFTLMLVLTLSLKAMVHDTAKAHDHPSLQNSVIAFLTLHGFELSGRPDSMQVRPIVAISADCRLEIREMVPQGWNRDRINPVGANNRLFFVFKGGVYANRPTGIKSPALSHYWTRLKQKLGFKADSSSILEVIASTDCSLDTLQWKDVAELTPEMRLASNIGWVPLPTLRMQISGIAQ